MFLRDTSDISDRTAIADAFGNQWKYGQLEALSAEYETIVPKRSLVLMLCDYSLESVAFYYCQMTNHVVPILADRNLKQNFMQKIIKAYEPQFIWCSREAGKELWDLSSSIVFRTEEHVLIRTEFEPYRMNPQLALLLTTSGSTGSVKLVRLSYENLRCNTRAYIERIEISENDRAITTLPMHYCYGLSVLHMHWMAGACVCVTEYSVLNVKFWEFFEEARITNFAGVPYTYDMLKQIGFLDKRYKSLRFVTQAGARLTGERQIEFGEKLQEQNARLYLCYGQTEATTYISLLNPEKVLDKSGSVGSLLSGMEASVVNPDDRGEGELVCKGPSISLGYAVDKSDLERGDDNHGCLHTGDIVYIDEDGDIFIKGRKSRFVKILGARVSLDELELALTERFVPVKFACTGADNRIRIYHTADGIGKAIRMYCSRELSVSGKFIECRFIEELPYTSGGKIKYSDLHEF